MKRKLLVIVPIVVVAAAAVLFFVSRREKDAEPKFLTAKVQKGDISILVTATGTLEAVTTVQVGSQVSGTISALYADFNDKVKKGEVLAQLDPTFLKAQVAQAEADLERARASSDLSRRQYERSLPLFETHMISESDRDIALTNYELAKTEEKSAQASLDRAQTNLDYATIRCPIDGVVISRNVDVGQTVAASLQAPTLFTIAQDLSRMQAKTSIDEADVGKIKEGQEAAFTVDAYPDLSFKGSVKQIRLSPETVQNVVTYDVIIEVHNPDFVLMPGMTANVTVLVDRKDGVLKVPSAALRFHPVTDKTQAASGAGGGGPMARQMRSGGGGESRMNPGDSAASSQGAAPRGRGQHVLWVLDPQGNPRPVPVQTGISDGSSTQIVSESLKEGDDVITGQRGVEASTNNQQVNPFAPRFGPARR